MTTLRGTGKVAEWIDKASGYLLAVATTCTATGVRMAMQHELEDRSRLMLFFPAVLITAWYGGVGPGLFALGLGAILTAWLLIPPANAINFGDRAEQIGMVVYLFVGVGIIGLVHRERQEKQKRESAQAELERLNQSLEIRVKERTQELETANRELEGFCYNVSHDLRTPTRAIVGNIRILLEDFGESVDGPMRLKLGRISRAAIKLSDLVDALLTYARLARSGLAIERVDLGELMAAEARHYSESLGIKIALNLPSQMIVYGDKSQLRSAIEAVVSNAVKYSKSGDGVPLTVAYTSIGSDTVISFCDEGIGFDMQYVHKIFQPFERLHRDDDYPGVGMGLAKVARIAERHHGTVWAESNLGEGSTFYLRLGHQEPAAEQEQQLMSA